MDSTIEFLGSHWPFFVMLATYWTVGHFMEHSIFTKYRAKNSKPNWFWWWMRESMELHPLVAGALTGLLWIDPEGLGWGMPASVGYFLGSGFLSLFGWMVITKVLEKLGLKVALRLPGESEPPKR